MKNKHLLPIPRLGRRGISRASAWFAILALAALAVPYRGMAQTNPNAFGATTLIPSSAVPTLPFYPLNLTAEVGTTFSVNLAFAVSGSQPYGAGFGIDARIAFDPTKLQVVSVSAAPSSPWVTPIPGIPTGFDNTAGTVRYAATGGAKSSAAFAVATIVFNPIAAGTSPLTFLNVNEYLTGYGPFGVNGLAVNGSVTVNAALPTQTLTILGGVGNPGDIAANVEYFNPATGQWQPAFLVNYAPYGHPVTHPWGNVAGTTRWINYRTDGASDPGAGPTKNQTLWYLYRVRFTVPSDAQDPKMTFSLKADNFAQVAINGVTTGGSQHFINNTVINNVIEGTADQVNADAVFSQNVQVGENTIALNIGDWGGLNGFNFRIDLSMKASQPLEIVPTAPADTTPPVITAPANIVTEATGPAGAVVTFNATANDNVDGAVGVTANPASGSTFSLGTTTVGLSASDAAGNTASASFTVTVQDTTPPIISAPAALSAEATGPAGAAVTFVALANDLVSGNVPVAANPSSGSTFPIGFSSVSLSASDAAGNSATGSILIKVQDTTPPALTVPASQVLEATSAAGAAATFAATATDAVGVASLTYSAASGSTFPLGTSTVTVMAQDAAGNTTTGSFTITVQDTTAPVISGLTPSSASLWPPNHKMVPITLTAAASDAVGIVSLKIISATSSEPDNGLGDGDTAGDIEVTGALTLNLRAERSGKGNGRVYTVTVEAKDAADNATTKTVAIAVPKNQSGK